MQIELKTSYEDLNGIVFNDALENDPELVNNDPYGQGWMIKVSITDASEIAHLMDAKAYAEAIDAH